MSGRLRYLPLLALLLLGQAAQAEEPQVEFQLSGLGGTQKREAVLGADTFFALAHRGLRLTIGLPLRFRPGEGVRKEDWDERTDYGRLIREVSYTSERHGVLVRVAPLLWYSLGTGNLVSMIHSTLDPDHWRTGLDLSLHGKIGGLDAFLDSILDPEILGTRLYVRPLSLIDPTGIFGRLEFAATLAGDIAAPYAYVARQGVRPLEPSGLPATKTKRLAAAGVDIRWPILRFEEAEVTPYFAHSGVAEGSGLHAGLALDLRPSRKLRLGLQGEFRWLGNGYVAPYFDTLYMVERYDFDGLPKAGLQDEPGRRYGFGTGFSFSLKDVFSAVWALDLDNDGRFTSVKLWAELFPWRNVGLTFGYAARGMPRFSRIVSPDRLLLSSLCEIFVSRYFSVFFAYSREPKVFSGKAGFEHYGSSDTLFAGVRLRISNR